VQALPLMTIQTQLTNKVLPSQSYVELQRTESRWSVPTRQPPLDARTCAMSRCLESGRSFKLDVSTVQ